MEQPELSVEEIRKKLNEQSFLGKFVLKDFGDKEEPLQFVCVIYLSKYPGFYYESLLQHFVRYAGKMKSQLWLSYENKPIQWHIPFFVSIDKINEEVEIIVHLKKRPENVLPIADNIQIEIKNRYFWNLKQACMIRYGYKWEKQIFQTITIEQQYQMFKHYSDQSNNLQFYDYFDKIWDLNVLKKETTINIPLRIYIDNLMIQRPYSFNDQNQKVSDILNQLFENNLDYEKIQVYVQGVPIELDCPVRLLVNSFVNSDGFTYLIIK